MEEEYFWIWSGFLGEVKKALSLGRGLLEFVGMK